MSHHCHAIRCATDCPPAMLMCGRHWRMVPPALQRAVWATYRDGQENDKQPSQQWFLAAETAILAVAVREGRLTEKQMSYRLLALMKQLKRP